MLQESYNNTFNAYKVLYENLNGYQRSPTHFPIWQTFILNESESSL